MQKRERFQTIIYDTAPENEKFSQDIILIFVMEGSIEVNVENKTSVLKTEDVMVINANKTHLIKAEQGALYMMLLVDYITVTEILQNNDFIFWCDSSISKSEKYNDLRILVRRMLKHYVEAGNFNFGYLRDCFAILNHLAANFLIRVNGSTDGNLEESDKYEERIRQINNYIYSNYDQDISMKDLSEKLYLSNGYLSRFFKKNYGMSFAGYLTKVRLYHAADDLLHSDAPITRIAYNNGFNSAALFNKVFKKAYGITPTEFRKNSSREETKIDRVEHSKELEKRLEKMLILNQETDTDSSDIIVAETSFWTKNTEPLKPYWKEIINFGDASYLLQSSVREHLLLLQKALGFKYVRFSGIFSKEMHIDITKDQGYNFGQIDSILDFILEQDMIPFIELGPKAKMIYKHLGDDSTPEEEKHKMDQFTLEKWTALLRAFMRHLINRYGQDVLDNWKMELWYDESWRMHPEKYNDKYLEFFNVTYLVIKSCNDRIQVGGYSIRMDFGAEKRKAFLERWNRETCRPDFISIMYYGYDRGEQGLDQYAKMTTDNENLLHSLTSEKELIEEAGFKNVTICLNEWNLTPSVRNYINDTDFKGAYIIKNILDIYGLVDSMGYGAGSDRMYSFYDTTEILFGGTGLMSNDGILKPAAFAFDFLNNRLFPNYIGKDKYYMVTTDLHDNFSIVCHNQQSLSYTYYLTNEQELEKDSMWKYYEGRKKLKIRIRLNDVSDGWYKVKVHRINSEHGSVLQVWEKLDFEKDPSRNDIKYLRRTCEPIMNIWKTEAKNGELLIEEELEPNEIAMIHVRKIWE